MGNHNRGRQNRLTAADLTDQIFQEKVQNMLMAGKPTVDYLMSTIPEVGQNAAKRTLQRCDELGITVCKFGASSREIHPDYKGPMDNVAKLRRAFPEGIKLSGKQQAVPLYDVQDPPDDSATTRAWQDALPSEDSGKPEQRDMAQAPSAQEVPKEPMALKQQVETEPTLLTAQQSNDDDIPSALIRLAEQLQAQKGKEAKRRELVALLQAKLEVLRQQVEQVLAGIGEVNKLIKKFVDNEEGHIA